MKMNNDFKILMVGATGVGKSSLLTSMYDVLKPEFKKHGCDFAADSNTRGLLDKQRQELKSYEDSAEKNLIVRPSEGIGGTIKPREYAFGVRLDKDTKDHDFHIRFTDVPGGWFTKGDSDGKVDAYLRDAQASIIAIDATALMYQPDESGVGQYHQQINNPEVIKDAYEYCGVGNGNGLHTVIYALVKAETYLEDGQRDELLLKAKNAYKELTEYLESRGAHVYMIPVKTAGCLRLHRFQKSENEIQQVFRRVSSKGYTPEDCDLPLRLVFKYSLEALLAKKRDSLHPVLIALTEFFGRNKRLKEVIQEVSSAVDSSASKVSTLAS